jgi:hypothetical protein
LDEDVFANQILALIKPYNKPLTLSANCVVVKFRLQIVAEISASSKAHQTARYDVRSVIMQSQSYGLILRKASKSAKFTIKRIYSLTRAVNMKTVRQIPENIPSIL